MTRANGFRRFSRRGLRVLDVLRLIQHDMRELVSLKVVAIDSQERVRCEHDIGFGDLREKRLTSRSVQHYGAHVGSKLFNLVAPVGNNRGRRDDEDRLLRALLLSSLFLQTLKECERLNGFSETHLVGEDAAELKFVKEVKPAHALFLIVTQLSNKALRGLNWFNLGEGGELLVESR